MKFVGFIILLNLVLIQLASSSSSSSSSFSVMDKKKNKSILAPEKYDFMYYVEQWPGSYCDLKNKCCYPTSGKPAANFSVRGLWPVIIDPRSWPMFCNDTGPFDVSQVLDLVDSLQKSWPTLACPKNDGTKFWEQEWEKHGACTKYTLNQHNYFEAALNIKKKVHYLKYLKDAGIKPDGKDYKIEDMKGAIKSGLGYTPVIECNKDKNSTAQIYQIYICVDAAGKDIIECPIALNKECNSTVKFPSF